jgi:hypothetical protein
MQNNHPAAKFDAFLSTKTPAEAAAIHALKFRAPATVYEWQLWGELQAEFARWSRKSASASERRPGSTSGLGKIASDNRRGQSRRLKSVLAYGCN